MYLPLIEDIASHKRFKQFGDPTESEAAETPGRGMTFSVGS